MIFTLVNGNRDTFTLAQGNRIFEKKNAINDSHETINRDRCKNDVTKNLWQITNQQKNQRRKTKRKNYKSIIHVLVTRYTVTFQIYSLDFKLNRRTKPIGMHKLSCLYVFLFKFQTMSRDTTNFNY